MHKLILYLMDHEKATLMDALYTAETTYRYGSRNLGGSAEEHALRIAKLIKAVDRGFDEEAHE